MTKGRRGEKGGKKKTAWTSFKSFFFPTISGRKKGGGIEKEKERETQPNLR